LQKFCGFVIAESIGHFLKSPHLASASFSAYNTAAMCGASNFDKKNFYQKLPRPTLVLAPLEQVTDAAFRYIINKYGKPHVIYTEFTSADGLCSPGLERLIPDLRYTEAERPIVAQIFGRRPETMLQAASICQKLGFDGIDINMGCPEKNVCKTGAGAGMINAPVLAKECIAAVKEGAGGLPVSVKTRIGFTEITLEEWIGHLLETNLAVITLHLRTRKEMSKVPAHWDLVHHAVELVAETDTLLYGNGDVESLEQARQMAEDTGVDGVMCGRAIFGNPWFFNPDVHREELSVTERLHVMLEHAYVFEHFFSDTRKHFLVMRSHFHAYVSGMPKAKEMRIKLTLCSSAAEAHDAVREYLETPFVFAPPPLHDVVDLEELRQVFA
jgi:nifR3 family TIM-barrel protein